MIRSIEIKNFKSIKSKYFPLRNLNVLLGLNGQGKSSFIQSLLILRQSADSLKRGVLQLNGSEFQTGAAKDALYQYAGKKNNKKQHKKKVFFFFFFFFFKQKRTLSNEL